MRTLRNIILTIAVIAIAGIGINALAHGGMGWGGAMGYGGGWGHHGPGWHHYDGSGYGGDSRWHQDDYRLLEQQREAFFKETQDIRSRLFEKEQELENELVKESPDASNASRLQKEISELQSEFDQKRIDHMIELRKSNPTVGRGFMMGGGHMMGYGPHTGGHCWE
jgi:hypothetical protein